MSQVNERGKTENEVSKMQEKIDTDPVLKKILDKLITDYQPERVILFGSYAWGLPHEDSDLDLLIIKETEARPLDRCYETRMMVSEVQGTTPVDIFVLTPREMDDRLAVMDPFVQEIVNRGIELYAA